MTDLIPPGINDRSDELASPEIETRHDEPIVVGPRGKDGAGYDAEYGGSE